jgi:hypothetical protein
MREMRFSSDPQVDEARLVAMIKRTGKSRLQRALAVFVDEMRQQVEGEREL